MKVVLLIVPGLKLVNFEQLFLFQFSTKISQIFNDDV